MSESKGKKISLRELIKAQVSDPNLLLRFIQKYGDVLTFWAGSIKGFVFTNPAHIRHIFSHQPPYVRSPQQINISRNVTGNYGLLNFVDFNEWKKERELLEPFFDKSHLAEYAKIMVKIFTEHYTNLQTYIEHNKPVNVVHFFAEIAMLNIIDTLFGGARIDITATDKLIRKLYYLAFPTRWYTYVKLFGLIPMPLYFRYKKNRAQLIETCNDIIRQSLSENVKRDNFIKKLAREYGHSTLAQLTAKNLERINSEVSVFLIAGYETAASLLVNICMFLSLYPSVADKIEAEVKTMIGSKDPTYEDLNKLPYLRAVINETLRLWPPLSGILRSAPTDDEIDGYTVKKGNVACIPTYTNQRNEKYWYNPEAFDPNRFLSPLTEDQATLYTPFGKGPQSCIGRQFAIMEATIAIAMLVQRYRLTLTAGISLQREKGSLNRLNDQVTMKVHPV